QDHYAVMHLLQGVGVAAGAVLNCKELLLDPHLRARDNFPMIRHGSPTVGVRAQLGPWFRLSETPGRIRRSAPTLGEHNVEILSGLLKLGSAELEKLQEEGVIGTEPKSVDRSMFVVAPLPVMKQLGIVEDFDANYKEVLGIE
ncbi:MAG: CoA transferase, partial [Chloroflexota bacterium]